uniref:Uncharacterized protein n=1 Tax=Bovine herpesvirus 4 TaxID=10385 RepID=A0A0F6N5A6_BHV4|nr:hypothetical protein pBo8 [Bovine gammaherpesvirus 4]QJC19215.1 putative protein pBo8 [Bovine gammaherpesvirus 4]
MFYVNNQMGGRAKKGIKGENLVRSVLVSTPEPAFTTVLMVPYLTCLCSPLISFMSCSKLYPSFEAAF